MKIELKPCPFCGGEAMMWGKFDPPCNDKYTISCSSCGVSTPTYRSKEAVAETWNRRANMACVKWDDDTDSLVFFKEDKS